MNDRIKQLRMYLQLSQKEFAGRIGLTHSAISKLESGHSTLTEQTTAAICREFNVNYDWLNGEDCKMLSDLPLTTFDELCQQYNLNDFSRSLVYEYLQLDDASKEVVENFIRNVLRRENKKDREDV